MRKEKLEEICRRLEDRPDMPVLILTDHEALEAFGQVRILYRNAHLVVMRGMRYITVTDAAVEVILEQLERERRQAAKVVEDYDRELAAVRELMTGAKKIYWSERSTAGAPALSERIR